MSKALANASLRSHSLLDHNGDGSLELNGNFDVLHADAPVSGLINIPFFSAPTTVLYSSDLNLPPAHTPEILMAAGGGGGASGGSTTTSGASLVNNGSGSGLSINLFWDS